MITLNNLTCEKWGLKYTEVGANVNEKFNMP